MRRYPAHDAFFRFCCELNALYRSEPSLWELDYDDGGFVWLEANDTAHVTYAFVRRDAEVDALLCALNLLDKPAELTLALPGIAAARTLIDTDWQRYGGQMPDDPQETATCKKGQLTVSLPACSGRLMKLEELAG